MTETLLLGIIAVLVILIFGQHYVIRRRLEQFRYFYEYQYPYGGHYDSRTFHRFREEIRQSARSAGVRMSWGATQMLLIPLIEEYDRPRWQF